MPDHVGNNHRDIESKGIEDGRVDAPIYPAYTFTASSTFSKWVKLTAADVHGLRTLPNFEGPPVLTMDDVIKG